jgi:hypothetical protein
MVEARRNDQLDQYLEVNPIDYNEIKIKYQSVPELASNIADQIMVTKVALRAIDKYIIEIDSIIKSLDTEIKSNR